MTTTNLGRWLLVAIAIVGLAAAAPAVSAHGDDTAHGNATAAGETPAHGDEAGWPAWMEGHMADYMGPDTVGEMESHMGATIDEMAQWMAGDDHQNTGHTSDDHTTGGHSTGMNGQGYGC
ncbi:hypothetical protein [Halolamina rubra]|uniref:hypothetical protein n=1 Tax=Halolamina rubra TaxID=1380430 RepID=UPI000679E674|nr:hypothetical protein [Halolamina rubra]